jgi:hypothetical protein
MTRWLVQLEGEHSDLEEFPHCFPDGDVYAIEENNSVYLVGSAFEKFSVSEDGHVHEAALQAVDELSAVIKLLWSSFQRPQVGDVFLEDASGKRQKFVYLAGSVTARSKVRGTLTVSGAGQNRKFPTQAQTLLSGLRTNVHLRTAMSLWADPLRTWPRLYRVLEEIEGYLGQPVEKVKLCSHHQRERFTRSANAAEISGKDARHALGKFEPPQNPMNLSEATTFIGGLLQVVLRQATKQQPPSTA